MNSIFSASKGNLHKNKKNKNNSLTGNSFGNKSKQKSISLNNINETSSNVGTIIKINYLNQYIQVIQKQILVQYHIRPKSFY